ncbi:MAG: thioredoxin family protein [Xanthobacteraceae bacterium]|nr:thioredoxin family protein [Xanthobacteraceae bacterium]
MLSPNRNTHQHRIVSRDEWLEARKAHLKNEKALTRMRDMVSAERRELPWVKIDKQYVFDTPAGKKTLAELFDGRSQLIVYHFMWRWDLGQGCSSCSLLADHIDGLNIHLANHDVKFVAISRGKLADLTAYKKRLGWKFDLVSSHGSDFNFDYHVSFTDEQMASGKLYYNYEWIDEKYGLNELPGTSVFSKDENGDVFHTYSSYARGGDLLLGIYNFLDLTPRGRNETEIMDWVKRHDEYGSDGNNPPSCCHS